MIRFKLNIFIKIIIFYYSLYYILVPYLYEQYFSIDSILYVPFELDLKSYFTFLVITFIICFIKPLKINIYNRIALLKPIVNLILKKKNIHLIGHLIFFIVMFMGQGLSSFRYSGVGISQGGIFLFIYSTFQSIIFYLVFYYIFSKSNPFYLLKKWSFFRVLLIFNLILSINGNFSAISNFFLISILIFPTTRLYLCEPLSKLVSLKNFFLSLVLIASLFFALLIGNSIKMGISVKESVNLYSSNELSLGPQYVFGYLFSTPYVSYRSAQNFKKEPNIEYIKIPINSLKYRISVIFGGDKVKPYYSTVNRFNFEKISNIDYVKNDFDQGTSPGLLASFRYINNNIIFLLLFLIYINFIKKRIIRIYSLFTSFNSIGVVFLTLFFFNIYFQSPLDLFNVIDNLFIILIFFEILYIKTYFKS